jgi:hypothetical protein
VVSQPGEGGNEAATAATETQTNIERPSAFESVGRISGFEPFATDGSAVYGYTDGKDEWAAFDYRAGEMLWERRASSYEEETLGRPAGAGHGYIYRRSQYSYFDYLYVFDAKTGEYVRQYYYDDDKLRSPDVKSVHALEDGALVRLVDADDALHRYIFLDSDTLQIASEFMNSQILEHLLVGENSFVTISNGSPAREYRFGESEPAWTGTGKLDNNARLVLGADAVVGGKGYSYGPAEGVDRQTGDLLWEARDTAGQPSAAGGGMVIFVGLQSDQTGRLVARDTMTGEVTWEITGVSLPSGTEAAAQALYELQATDAAFIHRNGADELVIRHLGTGEVVDRLDDSGVDRFVVKEAALVTVSQTDEGWTVESYAF